MSVTITNAVSSTGNLVISFNKNEEKSNVLIHSISRGTNVEVTTIEEARSLASALRNVWGV